MITVSKILWEMQWRADIRLAIAIVNMVFGIGTLRLLSRLVRGEVILGPVVEYVGIRLGGVKYELAF